MKFVLLNIKDNESQSNRFILGSNNHHMLTVNGQGSLDFINLQTQEMTGEGCSQSFDIDPDYRGLIPLVSFETLMQEIKSSLDFDSTDENEYNKAVETIQSLISKAEDEDYQNYQRMKNHFAQNIGEYMKRRQEMGE
jgi:hypothetical protein